MKHKIKNIFASASGSALEWFDFTLYGFFVHYIASEFFPIQNQLLALILAFGVFASGFLIRPIGAWIIGHIGDHFGRRHALLFTAALMSVSTIAFAILPGYATLGIFAPVLLTFVRLLQGFAISGELNTSSNFLIEYLPQNRRGLSGSLVMATSMLGILLGAVIATIISLTLSQQQMTAFGWRIPFLIAGLLGIIIFVLRLKMHESPSFLGRKKIERKHVHALLLKNWRLIVLGFFLTCLMAVANYFLIAYFPAFLATQGFSVKSSVALTTISMTVLICLIILAGFLSDKIGRKPLFVSAVCLFLVLSYPVFWLLTQSSFGFALLAQIIFAIILAPIAGLVPTVLAELFSAEIRNTAVALSYNLCLSIFGGTAPMISFSLIKITNNVRSPVWYLLGCAIVTLIALFFATESYRKELH